MTDQNQPTLTPTPTPDQNAPVVTPQVVYIKDCSFESPNGPFVGGIDAQPQVNKNRKLARLLQVGSGVMALLLIGLLFWSATAFAKFIGGPRDRASGIVTSIASSRSTSMPTSR